MLELIRRLEGRDDVSRRNILLEELYTRNWSFQLQEYVYAEQNGCNIIVDLNQTSGPTLLLTAHYDSYFLSPGANDDASALAILLDAGEKVKAIALACRVRIVFFDDEEPTLHWRRPIGSTMYVNEFGIEGLRAMITLELCGMGDAVAIWPVEGLEDRKILKELAGVLEEMKVPFDFGKRIPRFYSDYVAFREQGLLDSYCLTTFHARERDKLLKFAE